MTTEYLTIKEAAERYQKAEITIRRFVRKIVNESNNSERNHVRPNPSEAEKLKKKKKPFSYSISAEILEQAYRKAKSKSDQSQTASEDSSYLGLLQKTNSSLENQLQVKDDQIRALTQMLDELTDRQRESNLLMRGLQEQLLLKGGQDSVVDAEVSDATSPKKKHWWDGWV